MKNEKSKVYFGSIQHGMMAKFASFAAKVDKNVKDSSKNNT